MRKQRHFRCLLAAHVAVLAFVAAPSGASAQGCAGADALPSQSDPAAYADATLCLVNAERSAAGLGPLAPDPQLAAAAGAYAQEIVSTGVFAHRSADGKNVLERVAEHGSLAGWDMIGENLGTGTLALAAPRALVSGWMASPSHRANVLHGPFTHLGVGVVFGSPGDAAAPEAATYASAFGEASQAGESEPVAEEKSTRAKKKSTRAKKKKRRAKRRARRSRRHR